MYVDRNKYSKSDLIMNLTIFGKRYVADETLITKMMYQNKPTFYETCEEKQDADIVPNNQTLLNTFVMKFLYCY